MFRSIDLDGDRIYAGGENGDDGAVARLDLLSGAIEWSHVITGAAEVTSVAAGPSDAVSAAIAFSGTVSLPMASGTLAQRTSTGGLDVLVATLGADGQGIHGVEQDGGASADYPEGIAVDASGTTVVAGRFGGTTTIGSASRTSAGNLDGFVARYRTGAAYHGITPTRIVDTRKGIGGPQTKIGPGETRTIDVHGLPGIPTTGVSAVAVNVTAVGGSATSRLTVWPGGLAKPSSASVSFVAGQTRPNLAVVDLSPTGTFNYGNATGAVDVVIDVVGWFDQDGSGARFVGVTPFRLVDTRKPSPDPFGGGEQRDYLVRGVGGVPADATAVALNLTVDGPTAPSHLTVWPAGVGKPTASNLNFVAGQVVPNLATIKVGAGGKVSVFNNSGSTHVILDVVGYYTAAAEPGQLVAFSPVRLVDTATGTGGPAAKIGAGEQRTVKVTGTAGVPTTATAVVVNITATEPSAASHVTVWPAGLAKPASSNLNVAAGQSASNLVMVKLGTDGGITYRNNSGTAHLQIDVVGWYG